MLLSMYVIFYLGLWGFGWGKEARNCRVVVTNGKKNSKERISKMYEKWFKKYRTRRWKEGGGGAEEREGGAGIGRRGNGVRVLEPDPHS